MQNTLKALRVILVKVLTGNHTKCMKCAKVEKLLSQKKKKKPLKNN